MSPQLMPGTPAYDAFLRALQRLHPHHAEHGVRVAWQQYSHPSVAFVCQCGAHGDIANVEIS